MDIQDRADLLRVVARACTAPACAEVGVYRAQYAKMIWQGLRPSYLLLVDPWGTREDGSYLDYPHVTKDGWERMFQKVKGEFKNCPGVEVLRATSEAAASRVPNASLDFVYIDADHSYEAVCQDLRLWLPKVKSGGFIGGHDIDQRQVREAVMEVIGQLSPSITKKSGLKSYLAKV